MKNFSLFIFVCILLVVGHGQVLADQIHLKNGDRISGEIINETELDVTVKSQFAGQITINKDFVETIEKQKKVAQAEPQEKKKPKKSELWKNELSLGYTQAGGNTQNMSGSVQLLLNRKTFDDEWTFKAAGYYGSSSGELNDQKYAGTIRYAFSFGQRKWYNFYKFEGNRDRFSNINYRLIPSAGIGYWFSDTPEFKAMVEGALGFEHTNFRDSTESSNEAILAPRGFFKKKIFRQLTISEDVIVYPSLTDTGEYRFISQTDLTSPISDNLDLRLSFIDEYNSDPPSNTEKNDFRIISSLVYSF